MIDCFGVDVTEEELNRWDASGVSLWSANLPHLWADQPRLYFKPSDGFWAGSLPLDPTTLAGKRVMEIGSGLGRCAPEVAYYAAHYTGLDCSRMAVQTSRGRLREWPNVRFLHTVFDRTIVEASAGTWDVVFGTSFLIHQEPTRRQIILRKAAEWAKFEGLVVFDFWPGEPTENPSKLYGDWENFPTTPDVLRAEGDLAGLNLTKVVPLGPQRSYVIFQKRHHWCYTPAEVSSIPGASIGSTSMISRDAFLDTMGGLTIGEDCIIAPGAVLLTHDSSARIALPEHKLPLLKPVSLGDRVFVGRNAMVLPGVTVANDVVIGAGSVVAADVPTQTVVAGNPARKICSLAEYGERIRKDEETCET